MNWFLTLRWIVFRSSLSNPIYFIRYMCSSNVLSWVLSVLTPTSIYHLMTSAKFFILKKHSHCSLLPVWSISPAYCPIWEFAMWMPSDCFQTMTIFQNTFVSIVQSFCFFSGKGDRCKSESQDIYLFYIKVGCCLIHHTSTYESGLQNTDDKSNQ